MTTSSSRITVAWSHRVRLTLLAVLAACGGDGVVIPTPSVTSCGGTTVRVRDLAPLEHVVLSGDDVTCFALAGGAREYLVVPQLTGAALPYGGYGFRLGDAAPVTAQVASAGAGQVASPRVAVPPEPVDAQTRLDALLRQREAGLRVAPPPAANRVALKSVPVPVSDADTLRRFSVLSTLSATAAYRNVDARLRYAGARMLLYVDTLAANVLTDAELTGMGVLYDQRLTPAVTDAFGEGSDIDGNGRVIFLLTPTVNALVTAAECGATGFVRGFFSGHDLGSREATSNRAEIFYAFVPDETEHWSCRHTKADVLANLPPTFVHELQHMVSFGEHVVERGGTAEEVWLNEALSHMAEEIGALSYESRFPAPTGRTNPASIFPDSAAPFINPNLLYSYRYLFSSATYSLVSCAPGTFCSLAERGGSWLLLRWLTDQHGTSTLRRLVETSLTGRANLEAVTGRSTASLIGDFSLAVHADSIVGFARPTAPTPLRFSSRNLRRLYRALFEAYGVAGGVGRPFPLEPLPLSAGAGVTGTMRPGTFLPYRLRLGAGTPPAVLRLLAVDGTPFPVSSGAQVSVLRLP